MLFAEVNDTRSKKFLTWDRNAWHVKIIGKFWKFMKVVIQFVSVIAWETHGNPFFSLTEISPIKTVKKLNKMYEYQQKVFRKYSKNTYFFHIHFIEFTTSIIRWSLQSCRIFRIYINKMSRTREFSKKIVYADSAKFIKNGLFLRVVRAKLFQYYANFNLFVQSKMMP